MDQVIVFLFLFPFHFDHPDTIIDTPDFLPLNEPTRTAGAWVC